MSADDRSTVKTYVPQEQKERWVEHAEELDMSQSEFVRTMIQAGRRDFDIPNLKTNHDPKPSPKTNGTDLRDRILTELSQGDPVAWDDLVDGIVEGIEDEIEHTLEELQEQNEVMYSGRYGGYRLKAHD